MDTKRGLLLTKCTDLIEAHESDLGITATLKTSNRYRRQTEPRTSRRERIQLMGSSLLHTYYLEVLHRGPFESTVDVSGGESLQGIDRFQVSFFYAYADDDTYANSSQSDFETICYAEGNTPGLLVGLRDTIELGSGADRSVLFQPQNDVQDVIPMDESAEEVAHLLTFEIGLEG